MWIMAKAVKLVMNNRNNKTKLSSSIGGRLKEAREKKGMSIKEAAENIQVRAGYLESLEKGDYDNLPADVYTRGFLRKYAEFLELPIQELLDFYRKERQVFDSIHNTREKKEAVSKNRFFNRVYITRKVAALLVAALIVIIVGGYFWYQIRFLLSPPDLIVDNPSQDIEVSDSTINVIGRVEYDSFVKINNQDIVLGDDGYFNQEINLKSGLNILEIKAINGLGKESRIVRRVVYKTIDN